MLEINFSTILLQMANFFILVFILYRFLFGPLQSMLKKRAIETTRAMDEAKLAQGAAEEARRQYEEKTNNLDAEIAARKNEARIVIEQTRGQMLRDVQKQIDRLQSQTEETLSQMQSEAILQHKEKLGKVASGFVRGIMSDLMSPQLQKSLQDKFFDQIKELDLEKFIEGTPPGEMPYVKVITANPTTESYQERLASTLQKKLSIPINLTFEVDPALIAGGLLKFENELIDGSLQGQIEHFQKKYQEMV